MPATKKKRQPRLWHGSISFTADAEAMTMSSSLAVGIADVGELA